MKLKINNKEIEAFEGDTLIEAARRNNIDIPSMCYVAGYEHQPSCMVCVVVNRANNDIMPSCSTLAVNGMDIDAESNKVKELRKISIELLLSDHIAVCRPPCNTNQCSLRKLATEYRAKWNRYPRYSAMTDRPAQFIKGRLWFDVSKCIRCGLCVYNSNDGFTFKNRGFGMEVVLPSESIANVEEAIHQICPTQAIYVL